MDYVRSFAILIAAVCSLLACGNNASFTDENGAIELDLIKDESQLVDVLQKLVTVSEISLKVKKTIGSTTITETYSCRNEIIDGKSKYILRWFPNSREDGVIIALFDEQLPMDTLKLALARQIIQRRAL